MINFVFCMAMFVGVTAFILSIVGLAWMFYQIFRLDMQIRKEMKELEKEINGR